VYIDRGIFHLGDHSGFNSLISNGEKSFSSYEEMVAFIKGLSSLFNTVNQPQQTNSSILNHIVTSPRGNKYTFTFKFEKTGSKWRAYIVNSPSYGSRSTSALDTHRHYNGRHYICFEPEPELLEDMVNISKEWAKCTAKYIDTGSGF
jgi:hypothetical protein